MQNCPNCGNTTKRIIEYDGRKFCSNCMDYSYPLDTNVLDPIELKEKLDEVFFGQDSVKTKLSIIIFKHLLKVRNIDSSAISNEPSLLVGPSGSGKTFLINSISKILDIPVLVVDSNQLSEIGYVGGDTNSILRNLLEICDWDISKAERAIIYFDEIDKKSFKPDIISDSRDISGLGVQYQMLKMIDGDDFFVKKSITDTVKINTGNILFLGGGSFTGIEEIVMERNISNIYNFIYDQNDIEQNYTILHQDLIDFGIIPELAYRFSNLIYLSSLKENDYMRMLESVDSPINEYKLIFKSYGIELVIPKKVLQFLAKQATLQKGGGRAIRSLVDNLMGDIMFSIKKYQEQKITKITLTDDYPTSKKIKTKK